jgi:hypothetical protein
MAVADGGGGVALTVGYENVMREGRMEELDLSWLRGGNLRGRLFVRRRLSSR